MCETRKVHPIVTTKNFVHKHKEALIVAGVTFTVIAMQDRGIRNLNKFLAEKGLANEYYHSDYETES
jgi:hypothetical protein